MAVRTDAELPQLWTGGLKLDYFDPSRSLRRKFHRLMTTGMYVHVHTRALVCMKYGVHFLPRMHIFSSRPTPLHKTALFLMQFIQAG